MKYLLTTITSMMALVTLTVAIPDTAFADPPDLINTYCVDTDDRSSVRSLRNICDDLATAHGYNVGIFRPYNESIDGTGFLDCNAMMGESGERFSCLGAPGILGEMGGG